MEFLIIFVRGENRDPKRNNNLTSPEILLRLDVLDDYSENAIQASIKDLEEMLEEFPATWWNAYSQKYGIKIREYPYPARNGFFIDVDKRLAIYRFQSKGIGRRDKFLEDTTLTPLVPHIYRKNWFDYYDAIRCYSVLISRVEKLPKPIPVEVFGLYNSWGRVSGKDQFHHPRLIKATWDVTQASFR